MWQRGKLTEISWNRSVCLGTILRLIFLCPFLCNTQYDLLLKIWKDGQKNYICIGKCSPYLYPLAYTFCTVGPVIKPATTIKSVTTRTANFILILGSQSWTKGLIDLILVTLFASVMEPQPLNSSGISPNAIRILYRRMRGKMSFHVNQAIGR